MASGLFPGWLEADETFEYGVASLPKGVRVEDVPFSDMLAAPPYHDDNPFSEYRKDRIMSQTSGCNPGLYTNYKTKATKSKPKSKGK